MGYSGESNDINFSSGIIPASTQLMIQNIEQFLDKLPTADGYDYAIDG
jgi:hypothetical protein